MNRFIPLLLIFFSLDAAAQQMSWITACAEQNFCLKQNSCVDGQVFLVEKAVTNCSSSNINYSYKIDLHSDNIIDIQSSNDTVSGPIVKGTHRITWRASDNCGNLLQCTYTFRVKDCQPPNLLCINGLTQGIDQPDCAESFTASQFILTLTDNCTPTNQIALGLRKAGVGTGFPTDTMITFTSCEKGFRSIEVWAKDANGLANLCSNYVIIQDGNNDCICNSDADLYFDGCARTSADNRLSNFTLKTKFETLPGATTPLLKNYSQIVEDSCYTLHLDKIPFGADYQATIRGERTGGPLEGVTTYDLVLISKHILAIQPFTSVYQSVAADVNKSSSVTTFDILETRKLILGIYDTFPKVPAWRIVRELANPSQIADFSAIKDTYQITLTNLNDDLTFSNLDFIGIKYGDVNGSAFLTAPGAEDRYDTDPLLLRTKDAWLEQGETRTLRFQMDKPTTLEGWQIALDADPGKIQILEAQGLSADQYSLRGPAFRALWADGAGAFFGAEKSLFELKIKALEATKISDALFLDSKHMRPEAYSAQNNGATARHPLRLHFGAMTDENTTFFPPRPNPFSTETTFELLLKTAGTAQLKVFDLSGKCVYSRHFDLEAGLQNVQLPASALLEKGVYAYCLQVGDRVSNGRLVRI